MKKRLGLIGSWNYLYIQLPITLITKEELGVKKARLL